MGTDTKIEWADHSWSPWMGCQKVHTGCEHCYANRQTARLGVKWGPDGTRVKTCEAYWMKPMGWNKKAEAEGIRRTVFPSLCDPFEDWQGPIVDSKGKEVRRWIGPSAFTGKNPYSVPVTMDDLRRDMYGVIDQTPNLDWPLLTKRPENIRRMWEEKPQELFRTPCDKDHRENVYLLYSASDQETLESGIGHLLECRDLAPVLGLSLEPLVGPIDLTELLTSKPSLALDILSRSYRTAEGLPREDCDPKMRGKTYDREVKRPLPIGRVIVGGESGPNARPCRLEWIDDIRRQCEAAGVPCFVKQLGSNAVTSNVNLFEFPKSLYPMDGWPSPWKPYGDFAAGAHVPLKDPKGGDWSEWPEPLKVRQHPEVKP